MSWLQTQQMSCPQDLHNCALSVRCAVCAEDKPAVSAEGKPVEFAEEKPVASAEDKPVVSAERNLPSAKTSPLHRQHRGGREAAAPVFTMPGGCLGRLQISCLQTQQVCLLQTQQVSLLQTQQVSLLQTQQVCLLHKQQVLGMQESLKSPQSWIC